MPPIDLFKSVKSVSNELSNFRSPKHTPPPFPYYPGPLIMIDGHFEGFLTEMREHNGTGKESTKGAYVFYIRVYTDG